MPRETINYNHFQINVTWTVNWKQILLEDTLRVFLYFMTPLLNIKFSNWRISNLISRRLPSLTARQPNSCCWLKRSKAGHPLNCCCVILCRSGKVCQLHPYHVLVCIICPPHSPVFSTLPVPEIFSEKVYRESTWVTTTVRVASQRH